MLLARERVRSRFLALVVLLAAPAARADWEVGVATSYLRSSPFRGFGGAGYGLWNSGGFAAVGAQVDVARLSASAEADNRMPARQVFSSIFVAALLQARLPLGPALPYAEVAVGHLAVETIERTNTSCEYASDLGFGFGGGIKVRVESRLALGLRWFARPPGALHCTVVPGPWTFEPGLVHAFSITADYRW
jgi:hypothetical protein